MNLSPARSAAFARDLRTRARAARQAGEYPRAAVLSRMAATTQSLALLSDFGATR